MRHTFEWHVVRFPFWWFIINYFGLWSMCSGFVTRLEFFTSKAWCIRQYSIHLLTTGVLIWMEKYNILIPPLCFHADNMKVDLYVLITLFSVNVRESITWFMSSTYTGLKEIMSPHEFQFRKKTHCGKIFLKNVFFSESYRLFNSWKSFSQYQNRPQAIIRYHIYMRSD